MQFNELEIHNIDVKEFIAALDQCKGDVFLETSEGDVLNLKSKLCQIAGLANILSGAVIAEATIRCTNPDDERLLFRFNLYHELPNKQNEQ